MPFDQGRTSARPPRSAFDTYAELRDETGRSVADPSVEFGKLRGIGHMGHVREYSAREVARFLQTCGFAIHFLGYRHHKNKGGWKRKLLRVAYLLAPRQFHREIVIVARKISRPHRLSPLVPVLVA